MKISRRTFFELEWIVILVSFIPVLLIISSDKEMAENWTRNFIFIYQTFVGSLFKYLPFSMTEIVVVSLVVLLTLIMVLLIIDIFKKRKEKIFHKTISIVLIGLTTFCLYYSTASIAYYRDEIDLPLYKGEALTSTDYVEIINYFTDDYNYCANVLKFDEKGEVIQENTLAELNQIIADEYAKLESSYFNSFTTNVKPMVSSYIYREFNITGLTFTPLGESNLDYLTSYAEYPFTMAHELAHSKGVMREEDAQLTALYITLNSDNPLLRFSGYVYSFSSIRNLSTYMSSAERNSLHEIDNKVILNRQYIAEYWSNHNILIKISTFINNLYLSAHNDGGVVSYDDDDTNIDNNGTEEEPVWVVTSYSRYQRLYFGLYFN